MSTAIETYKSGIFDLTHKLTVEKHGHTALITINPTGQHLGPRLADRSQAGGRAPQS
jgi:hypothetical protein